VSRREPELPSGRDFDFVSVELRDEKAAHGALSPLTDVSHVAYAAIYENAGDLVGGWSNADQIEVNNAMLRNVIEPLVSGKSALEHVSILQRRDLKRPSPFRRRSRSWSRNSKNTCSEGTEANGERYDP